MTKTLPLQEMMLEVPLTKIAEFATRVVFDQMAHNTTSHLELHYFPSTRFKLKIPHFIYMYSGMIPDYHILDHFLHLQMKINRYCTLS